MVTEKNIARGRSNVQENDYELDEEELDGVIDAEDFDYADDIRIDVDRLEVEWLRQPHLYKKYARLAEDANDLVRKAKQYLDLKRAIADETVREEMKVTGEKITEKVVESKVLQHPIYTKALDRYNRRLHEYNVIKNVALDSIHQKKSALENLVKLGLAEWFAAPIEPRSIQQVKELSMDVMDEKVRQNLNKNKRSRTNAKSKKKSSRD
jgi:hypothetical protein